jgi:hypothetical protein
MTIPCHSKKMKSEIHPMPFNRLEILRGKNKQTNENNKMLLFNCGAIYSWSFANQVNSGNIGNNTPKFLPCSIITEFPDFLGDKCYFKFLLLDYEGQELHHITSEDSNIIGFPMALS